mgnify:CR=1 FL=1
MKNFIKWLIVNILISFLALFVMLYVFFLLGSGSAGFNDNWYLFIIGIGIIHFITISFYLKAKPKYYLLIPLFIFGIYLYFYFE